MRRAYISLGSNIKPRQNVVKALCLLSAHQIITGISTVYRTRPELNKVQPYYYNCVAAVRTALKSKDLKYNILRKIEGMLGRKRKKSKYASRTIDLDLMSLSDPQIRHRPYLALCLKELGCRKYQAAELTYSFGRMRPLPGYTKYLRTELRKMGPVLAGLGKKK